MMKKIMYTWIVGISLLISGAASASMMSFFDSSDDEKKAEVIVIKGPAVDQFYEMVQKLNLTDEQKQKISDIIKNAKPQFQKDRADIKANNKALYTLCGDQYDAQKVADLANAQAQIVSNVIQLRFQVHHAIYEVLTPEQKEKCKEMMKNNNM